MLTTLLLLPSTLLPLPSPPFLLLWLEVVLPPSLVGPRPSCPVEAQQKAKPQEEEPEA